MVPRLIRFRVVRTEPCPTLLYRPHRDPLNSTFWALASTLVSLSMCQTGFQITGLVSAATPSQALARPLANAGLQDFSEDQVSSRLAVNAGLQGLSEDQVSSGQDLSRPKRRARTGKQKAVSETSGCALRVPQSGSRSLFSVRVGPGLLPACPLGSPVCPGRFSFSTTLESDHLSRGVKDVWSRYPLVMCLFRHVCGPEGARCDMYLFVEVMYVAYIENDVYLFPKELVFG